MDAIAVLPAYDNLEQLREMFGAYTRSLGIDLTYQGYREELEGLPGKYALPGGRLYLAWKGGEPCGCIGLRPFDEGRCEIKRLYVPPRFRGCRVGRLLLEQVLDDARAMGYRSVLLDTLSTMESAQRLYRAAGFREIPAYYDTPVEGTRFFHLPL